jgi:hypothetical protein
MRERQIKALAAIAGVDACDEYEARSLELLLDSCAESVAPGPNLFRPAPTKIRDELEKARRAAHALKSALADMSPEARLWLKAEPVMVAQRERYQAASMRERLTYMEERPLSSEEAADAFLANVAPSRALSLPLLSESLDRLVSSLEVARDAQQYRAFSPKAGAVDVVANAASYWQRHTKWKLSASESSRFRQFIDMIFDHIGVEYSDKKKTVISGLKLSAEQEKIASSRVPREKIDELFSHFFADCAPEATASVGYLVNLMYDECDGDLRKTMELAAALIAAEKGDPDAKKS